MVVEDAAGGRVDEHGSKPPRGPRQPREEAGLGGGQESEVASRSFRPYDAYRFPLQEKLKYMAGRNRIVKPLCVSEIN